MTVPGWHGKVSNPAQIGGIETSVLDNGLGRSTRIAWVNTGSGLRYKVVIDRGMDIADAFYNQHSLAWLSQGGIAAAGRFSNRGLDWLRTFGGGLLTTCGLTHVGGPETDSFGERGLHDQASGLQAVVESIIQPDPLMGRMEMSITGRILQTQVFGPTLELKRTISATLGDPRLRIHDEVVNRGNLPAPHMLLYHCNFGWPLADEGTRLCWKGDWRAGAGELNDRIFKEGHDFRACPSPLEEHLGSGEAVAFINITPDAAGECRCGLHNPRLGIALTLAFQKEQLPWLINWQHWGKGEYVTALEPATHPPIGQSRAREEGSLIFLQPGEARSYDLEMEVLVTAEKINDFIKEYDVIH